METLLEKGMKITKVPLDHSGSFSKLFLDYVMGKENLESFYSFRPEISQFEQAISQRKFPGDRRIVLQKIVSEQYGPLQKSQKLEQNIYSLQDEKTFTVTTGHQLNIFTGPLYFIFKIVTTINLARKLKEKYPEYHFVPVYWMASEDHDFDEIRSFNLFGKTFTWETEQNGAVGRFATQSLNVVLEQMPETLEIFEKAYLDSSSLAEATRHYCNDLFGEEGLIALDADNPSLKGLFKDVMKADITENRSAELVGQTNDELSARGYKNQAFARDINFFYLNGFRERIVKNDNGFEVLNQGMTLSGDELIHMIEEHPEKFSPNVIMRPLYQETILPNLAYIGGPAEIIYWLQLKRIFDQYETPFPILMPRNFGMVITRNLIKKIEKIGCSGADLFKESHELKADFLERNSNNEHFLNEERSQLEELFGMIQSKAAAIDKSLEGYIGAESAKVQKELDTIEKKLKKAQENQNETSMNQIEGVKDKLFPNGSLQERHDNFLNFYLNNPNFIKEVMSGFDPFEFSFYQFWEE